MKNLTKTSWPYCLPKLGFKPFGDHLGFWKKNKTFGRNTYLDLKASQIKIWNVCLLFEKLLPSRSSVSPLRKSSKGKAKTSKVWQRLRNPSVPICNFKVHPGVENSQFINCGFFRSHVVLLHSSMTAVCLFNEPLLLTWSKASPKLLIKYWQKHKGATAVSDINELNDQG